MWDVLRVWYREHFSDPQVVILALLLIVVFAAIMLLGDLLAPLLVATVLAYLLEGTVQSIESYRIPRVLAVAFVFLIFLLFCFVIFFGLVPLLSQQVVALIRELPNMIVSAQSTLLQLPELYPTLVTAQQIQEIIAALRSAVASMGQTILSLSLAHMVGFFTFLIYTILVPLLVFFALKDKKLLLEWFCHFLPNRMELASRVWSEVDQKIGNYVRGKFIEIIIIWIATYITFALMGLNYSLLLSFLVGISVIIPFVGAVAVTLPVAIIAYFQWGFSAEFGYLLLFYQIIQVLDGNILVPILFSEVVNLHPTAIIVAVLFFGGIWGVWGIFFAIPLATLVQAVINAWPAAVHPETPPTTHKHAD